MGRSTRCPRRRARPRDLAARPSARGEDHPTNPRAVVASELMRAMARRGLPVRVLDVAERRVTSVPPWRQGKTLLEASNVYRGFARTRATEHFNQFGAALDDCALVGGQMMTPQPTGESPSWTWIIGSIPSTCRGREDRCRCHRPPRSRTTPTRSFRDTDPDPSRREEEHRPRITSRTFPCCAARRLRRLRRRLLRPSVPQVHLPIAVPPPFTSTPAPPVASRPETWPEEPRPRIRPSRRRHPRRRARRRW